MSPPANNRILFRIITGEIVFWNICIQSLFPVTVVFILQGQGIVFQVARDKDLAVVF